MKAIELLVFAGQSNMMGACALPPKNPVVCRDSFEYKHKMRRLTGVGAFLSAAHPAGEFSYADLPTAYASERVADNMVRVLKEGLEPKLADEMVIGV